MLANKFQHGSLEYFKQISFFKILVRESEGEVSFKEIHTTESQWSYFSRLQISLAGGGERVHCSR